MRPTAESRTLDSTLVGEDVAMGIDDKDMAHVMSLLSSGLYADEITAFIREYSTNAADAHVEAGTERQIEVSTPTELRPVFTVRDYGVGLSADDIRRVYSRYGASTKRETNAQTGVLGLGCKSALGYCDQFTVTGVKTGYRTTVNVSRDETGAGRMKVIEEAPTDEPNGVTVAVPVKQEDVSTVVEKAERYFRYWRPGTVLLDGGDPVPLGGYELTPDLHITTHKDISRDILVMGNVPYPADLEALPSGYGLHIVAYVPIGDLHFTPSREALQETPTTEATIARVGEEFQAAREGAMARALEGAEDRPSALRAFVEARSALYPGARDVEASYLGHPVPRVVKYGGVPGRYGGTRDKMRQVPNEAPYYKHGKSEEYDGIGAESAMDALWVLGFDNQTFTKPMRKKLDRYISEEGIEHEGEYVLTPRNYVPMRAWLNVRTIEWEDVRAIKLPRDETGGVSPGGPSMVGHYEATGPNGWDPRTPATELAKAERLFYTQGNEYAYELLPDDATLVHGLTQQRIGKFKRLFPEAVDKADWLREEGARVWECASEEERDAWTYEEPEGFEALAELDPKLIDDPALAAEVRHYQANQREEFGELTTWDTWLPERQGGYCYGKDRPTVLRGYPLLQSDGPADHLHLYVNAVYAAEERK